MSAREAILARVAESAPARSAHPGPHRAPADPGDLARFRELLARVGGAAHGPCDAGALGARVGELARERAGAGRWLATARAHERLGAGPWRSAAPAAAPASYADVAVAIATGVVGVAESGAVAVLEDEAPERALLFLCQHLILLLPAERIVASLHQGFAALPATARVAPRLTWISGPSKTADIEQALVYGAHGPLSLDVVLTQPTSQRP